MGFSKMLNFLKMGDDFDDDFDDEYDDYDDDEYYNKSNKSSSFFNKKSKNLDDDFYDEPSTRRTNNNYKVKSYQENVSQLKPVAKRNSGMSVAVIKPTTVDDGREICETLLRKQMVILNIEGLDIEVGQRIFDFTYGATFAIGGNLQKISNYIFLATPDGVDSSGDLTDLFGDALATASSTIKPRY